MKTSKNGLTPILAAAAAKEPWKHWGVSEKSLMDHAKSEMKRLKARTPDDLRKLRKKNRPSFPQDGSSGQYDAWSESLAQMIELEKQGKQAKIASLEDRIAALQTKVGSLGPVSLGEMMGSAANQVRLFNNLKGAYGPYLGVYEEVGMNLIRFGHTEDEEEREFIKSEIDTGLKYLKKRDKEIQKGAKALGALADAFHLVAKSIKRI